MGPLQFIADYIEKARSYIYGIYIFWLVIFCLPIIFTVLFVDQELIYKETELLKGEYILDQYFNPERLTSYLYVFLLAIGPLVMTRLVIWVFPQKIIKPAYAQELKNQYEREFMRLEKEEELTKRREQNVSKEEDVVKKEEENLKKQENLKSREQRQWDRDYRKFQLSSLYNNMRGLLVVLYERSGYFGNGEMSSEELAYAESHGLVDIDRAGSRLSLTEKGKYFISVHQDK